MKVSTFRKFFFINIKRVLNLLKLAVHQIIVMILYQS